MRKIIFAVLALALIIVGFFVYKDLSRLTVSELNERATEFDGRTVSIVGTVARNAGVMGLGGFIVTDGASSILVLSSDGVPEYGTEIDITGNFKKAITLNSLEFNVIYAERYNQK